MILMSKKAPPGPDEMDRQRAVRKLRDLGIPVPSRTRWKDIYEVEEGAEDTDGSAPRNDATSP